MTRFETPRVAIIGAGEIGRGWAVLTVAAGWPVTLYDSEGEHMAHAVDAITDRVSQLINLRRAQSRVAEGALDEMRVGRSLLHAVSEADWIIEAVPEDLSLKQKTLQQAERVARRAAVLTSSATSLGPTALAARLEHPDRFLVAHPLNPVELVPLVELVPSAATDPEAVEDVRFWLGMLGRAPVVFRKEVRGNFAARLAAAVWRECIQMVLDGVVDVEDVDRAMSMGPALAWAAAGPHLDQQLTAGPLGLGENLSLAEPIWKSLAEWKQLAPEDQKRFMRLIEKAYGGHTPELAEARIQRLVRLLEALSA